jgi:hypothetical protein
MGDFEAPHGRPTQLGVVCGGGTVFAFELGEVGAGRSAMKRTPGALRQKALDLGLPLGHRR